MIYGKIVGDFVVLSALEDGGKEIVETAQPTSIPSDYTLRSHWEDNGSEIIQVWDVVPVAGTESEAAIKLAQMQAQTLTNEQALEVPMLYPEWGSGVAYKKDAIIRYKGELYRIAQDTISQDIYPPDAEGVDALYTHITIDEETGYEEWKQPTGAHDAYSYGDIVKCDDKLWISTVEGTHTNTWKPGEYGWGEYVEE